MHHIYCPSCGYQNRADQMTCEACDVVLYTAVQNGSLTARGQAKSSSQRIDEWRNIIYFLSELSGYDNIDVPQFLANFKIPQIDFTDLKLVEALASLDMPNFDISNLDMPDVDSSNLVNLFTNVDLPDVDISDLLDLLANVDLPDVDISDLLELLDFN